MKTPTHFWMKTVQALTLAVVVCFSMGATDAGQRFTDLGHRLMCTCGCAQLLGECNHVGCTESGKGREELKAEIAKGMSDKEILASFAAKYGATALAAPTAQGFDLVAWVAPFAVCAMALLGTILLVRRWSGRSAGETGTETSVDAPALNPSVLDPASEAARQALKDKIRRETDSGNNGGF